MAHPEQFEFVQLVRTLFPAFFTGKKVLEIGSLDINGSIRDFFSGCDYTGLDIAPGKGVDVVCEGQLFDAPEASFDVVISCEAMEHNPFWQATLTNMIRMTKPGGLVVMSCATLGRPEHGTTRSEPLSSPLTIEKGWDYYRNLSGRDIVREIDMTPLAVWGLACNWKSYDLYFLGLKFIPEDRAIAIAGEGIREFKAIYRNRLWSSVRWLRRAARKHLKHSLLGRA